MQWSIRTKIIFVLSALLLGAIFAYLVLANRIFREDKELLIFDSNRSNTERLASEFESSVRRVTDKMELLAKLLLNSRSEQDASLAKSFFESDPELVAFQIFSVETNGSKLVTQLLSQNRLKILKLTPERLKNSDVLIPGDTKNAKEPFIDNRSLPEALLYTIRVPIELKSKDTKRDLFARVVIDGRNWLDDYQNQTLSYNFAVTSTGRIFAGPRAEEVSRREDLSNNALVRIASGNNLVSEQVQFSLENKEYLGVYQKTSTGGVTVFSMTDKSAALIATRLLLEKTIVLSLIIVTVVLLVSLWFAGSLSTPILGLVRAAGDLAKGRFDTPIEVHSQDEIGRLAMAFDKMARDLKSSRLQLEDYSHSLEIKVQERTRELEDKNVAIREQQDVLLRTARLAAVGETAGQAAHEVLNPLTGMVARLEAVSTRLSQYLEDPKGGLAVFSAITKAWDHELRNGGIRQWRLAVEKPSSINSTKTLIEEDLANLMAVCEQTRAFGAQLRSDIGILLSESFRIERIVDGMRGLSRASKVRSLVDIGEVIRESVRASEDLLARYKIKIETKVAGKHFVNVDRDEMRQVFANLIKNAMDAIEVNRAETGAYGASGLIRFLVEDKNDKVSVVVWDNGIGISPNAREQLFEANFSTKGPEGTGFGLSICRRFVRAAGGDLVLRQSVPGKFTEFELTLPAVKNADA